MRVWERLGMFGSAWKSLEALRSAWECIGELGEYGSVEFGQVCECLGECPSTWDCLRVWEC